MESSYIDPKSDFAFKKLFRQERNKDLLIGIINAVLKNQLHHPVVDVSVVPSNLEPEIRSKKESYIDVLCHDQDGCQYIVEMQVAKELGFEKRAQYYAARTFVDQMNKGENYRNLKQVIFLSFLDCIMFPNKADYKSEHVTLDKKTGENDLDLISFTFVELPKFDQQKPHDLEKFTVEEKLYYLLLHANNSGPEVIKKLIGQDYIIRRAFEELNKASFTEEELLEYRAFQKYELDSQVREDRVKEEGRKEGIAEGRKEGIKEGKEALLQKLVAAGLVSEEEVKRLR